MTSVPVKPQKERTQPRQNSVDRDLYFHFYQKQNYQTIKQLTIKALDNIQ